MLKTVVKKGSYQDSVVLMLLTNELSSLDGVNKIQVMMATPANKDIFRESGLTTDELMDATANDMVVVADVNDEAVLDPTNLYGRLGFAIIRRFFTGYRRHGNRGAGKRAGKYAK